jgi:predicted glycosyltransferase
LRIWIDLATPPQVLFFRPIYQALRQAGYPLLVTVRDFSRAPEIAVRLGMEHRVIGRHGGKGTRAKGLAILRRVGELAAVARKFRPDIAVSHNSYAQALASPLLRVPLLTAMDYEHQPANHISFRIARRVLVPEPFPESALRKYGASPRRVVRYPGVKEEVYLADFQPDPEFPTKMRIPSDRVLVSMRPPARSAIYHRFDNPLFDVAVHRMADEPNAYVVLLDRTGAYDGRFPNVHVPRTAVDGPNLLYWSDLVIGGGGTMNREAAVLGTPVYNLYAGEASAVDDYLVALGRMARVTSVDELDGVIVRKKTARGVQARADGLQQILEVLTKRAA